MRNAILLTCFFLLTLPSLSANPDSLRQLLRQATDPHRQLTLIRQLGNALTYSNPDSAMICADLALERAAKAGFEDIRCQAMLDKAILFLFNDQADTALRWLAQAEPLVRQVGIKSEEYRLFDLKGKFAYQQHNTREGIAWFEKSLAAAPFSEVRPKRAETLAHIQIGNGYKELREFRLALSAYEKAEKLALQYAEAKDLLGFIYNNRAGIFGEIGDYQAKLDDCRKGLRLLPPNDYRRANLYNNLGDAFLNLYQPDSARVYFKATLDLKNVKRDNRLRALLQMAYLMQQENQLAQSRAFAEEALTIGTSIHDLVSQIDAHFVVGEAWYLEKNYTKAIHSMEDARSLFALAGEKDVLYKHIHVDEKLLQYQLTAGNPGLLPLFRELNHLKDSLYQRELVQTLSDYKLRLQQDSIQMLHLESEAAKAQVDTRNKLLAAALLIALLLTALAFYWRRSYRLALERESMLAEQHQNLRKANETLLREIERKATDGASDEHILEQTITFPTRDNLTLRLGDILYLKSLGGGVTYVTTKGKFHVWQTLNQSRELLPENLFAQVHRSYIVNRRHIVGITQQSLALSDKIEIPVGATYRDSLKGWNR